MATFDGAHRHAKRIGAIEQRARAETPAKRARKPDIREYFDCLLDHYVITKAGRLAKNNSDVQFHGMLRFHAFTADNMWFEYEANFADARLIRIEPSMSKIPKSVRKELAALVAKPETEIDFSDVPATSERDWRGAERGKFYRPVKRQLTVRIDADVIEWLKSQGRGYQSRLNEILRAAMLAKLRHR